MYATSQLLHYSTRTLPGTTNKQATFQIAQPSAWRIAFARIAIDNTAGATAAYASLNLRTTPYLDLNDLLYTMLSQVLGIGSGFTIFIFGTTLLTSSPGGSGAGMRLTQIPDLWLTEPGTVLLQAEGDGAHLASCADLWIEVINPLNAR